MSAPYAKPAEPELVMRPFRIWDAKNKVHCVGRNYAIPKNAQDGALLLTRWAKVDSAYEVYDIRTGRLLAQYVRKPTGILFIKG